MATIGIDLGTTYCAVAALDEHGKASTLPNQDGEILTPSAIYFGDNGDTIVGQPALDMMLEQPERVATLFKRKMGRESFGPPILERDFRPETLSAIMLRKLAQDAAVHVGPVTHAVITVPAYFDDTRRRATTDAAKIAGLEVLDIIDEPSAAALAYTFQTIAISDKLPTDAAKTVMVYDLGGGTFDVTLVKMSKKRFHVLGIEGDVQLGGRDWDERMVLYAAKQFQDEFHSDPLSDPQSQALLYSAAERAKRSLSKVNQARVTISHAGHNKTIPIDRDKFESLTADLLLRTRLTAQQVLNSANLQWSDVDQLLLVGGSTHMPMTARMLTELTGKEPERSLAVSEVVARGAAIHAGIMQAKDAKRKANGISNDMLADIVEVNVNAHTLGIEVRKEDEKLSDQLILKNTQLPAASSRVYFTAKKNQKKVRVRVLQGEAHQADACISVGECWIDELPANLPARSPIQVRCGVAANGMIEVLALDMTSGRMARAEIHRSGGLEEADIAREADYINTLTIQ